jgi:tetratricopeptide (TPR) repeat protein
MNEAHRCDMYIVDFMRRISAVLLFCLTAVPAFADEPLKLLIFPLSGSTEGVGTWVGEGIALSLSGQLTEAGIRPFSHGEREDLFMENGLPQGAPLSRGSMIFIAEQADADFVVMGSYAESEDSLKLSVRLLDMKTMKQGSEFTVSGSLATLPEMENELAWMVYSSIARTPAVSREQFRERARRAPNSAYASYVESLDVFEENQKLQLLEKAVKEYADFAEARFRIGLILYQKKDYARALPHMEYGRKLQSERLQSEFMIGTCRLQLGETARAIEDYTRFLSAARHAAALNNMAVAHVRNGDNVSALRALVEARAQKLDDPSIAINLVIARYLAGNAPSAMEFVKEAVAAYPANGMMYFLSSFLMEEAGDKTRASEDRARAARFGVDVDGLLREKPQTWMRVILNWTNEE